MHIDCDISSSLEDIQIILTKHNLLADKCYILFDDYGCMDSYKQSVEQMMNKLSIKFIVKNHSQTRYTKNYSLEKK